MGPTTAPDVTNDVTIGQQVVSQTATPTATSASATSSPSPSPTASSSPKPTTSSESESEFIFEGSPFFTGSLIPISGKPLSIYGYGPAGSLVFLNGIGVSGQVTARRDGYFKFTSIYSHSDKYPELCIQAVDDRKRSTQPVCIPAIPQERLVPIEIGPVLLSPTVSLSSSQVVKGSDVTASGYTIPGSKVSIYFAKDENRSFNLVAEALAYNFSSDEKGYFELSIPTETENTYKIFAASRVGDVPTAKSNTLTLTVLSKIISLWQLLWDLLFRSWISLVILLQVVAVVILSYLLFKSSTEPHRITLKKLSKMEKKYLEFLKLRKK